MEADIALVWLVAAFAIVETGCGGAGGRVLRLELEARGQDLLHKQTGGDSFERIVHRFRHRAFGGIWLGDQIGEAGMRSEERRVGKTGVRTCRSRWLPSK